MSNRTVLITGAAGFLGSNLLPELLELGYTVRGLDRVAGDHLQGIAKEAGGTFEFVQGDIRDAAVVNEAAKGAGIIIHLAESKIPRYGDAMETLEINVEGTENILNAARESKARFILGSTDEVYGKSPHSPLNEESLLVMGQSNVNRWSLGVSKLMAEQLCFAYADEYDIPVTILRYFAAYGPYQPADWRGGAQSVFIKAALAGDEIPIHGDGLQVRSFVSVRDLVAGTLLALQSPYAAGEIINIASDESISIINLAYLIWRLAGAKKKPELTFVPYTDFSRNYEDVPIRTADISKAHYLLGYEPTMTLVDGLEEAVAWQRDAITE